MNRNMNNSIAILITSLMLVWPVMFTIGLRYTLAGLLLIFTVGWSYPKRHELKSLLITKPILWATGLLVLLSAWFVFQALWIVPESNWVWDELRGQWLKDMVFWILGLVLGVGAAYQGAQGKNLWQVALVAGLIAIVVLTVAEGCWIWFATAHIPVFFNGITGSRTMVSFVTNMLLAFLVGDLLARDSASKFLPWSKKITVSLIMMCLLCTLFIATRHGWIGVVMLTFSGLIIHYIKGWSRVGKKALLLLPALILLIGLGAWASWKNDSRWNTLRETLPIAWDIDTHKAWLNHEKYPFPQLPNGQVVNDSNYERPAWIHAGLRIVAERPLGTGFSRHAFGHELVRLYPEAEPGAGKHAHSSMIDLAIGGGLPAVALWMAFVALLVCYGTIAFFRHGSGAGLVMAFLASGFLGRSLLDSVMRDHSMEQFMFIIAFLLPIVSWNFTNQLPPQKIAS